ncbi:MAG: Sodium/proline symporter [Syntrophaceae bacterium PtaB.Bin038]|nr:MAG: Sodium/proline symporter [Syntrophaceae bacterium PtaB.Bin038]
MDEQLIQPTPSIIGFTVFFMLISIAIGWYANKFAKTAEGFFGGTKMFGGLVIGLASCAAVMSAFGFIGGPGLVYKFGFTSIWMTIACGPGFAYGYWVIGKRMRAMAEVTDVATLPDIARVRFQSQTVRGILALGLCLAAIAYLSSQVKGGAKLMNQMLGVSEEAGVVIMFGTTLAYMLVSGMSGSILTDAFQGAVMLCAVLGVVFAFFSMTGGDFSVIQNSPNFGPTFVDGAGAMPFQLVIAFAMIFFIGVMGQPTMLAKMYAVKSHKDLKLAGWLGGVAYGATSLVWILVGYGAIYLVATAQAAPIKDLDKAAFLFVSKTGGVMQALIMAGLLAAIVSTASFFISLASGALTRDLAGAMGHEIAHDRQIIVGRYLQVVVIILCIGFGYWGGRAVAILGTLGWGFFASVTLPTFTMGLLWRRCSREAIIAALAFAVVANIACPILENFKIWRFPFPYYVFTIGGSIIITTVVSFFTSGAAGENMPNELKPIFKL